MKNKEKTAPGSRTDFIANRPTLCFQDGTFHSNPSISVLSEPYYKFARFLDSRKSQLFLSCSWPIVLMHPHKLHKMFDFSGCLWYGHSNDMTYTFSLRLMFSRGASKPFFFSLSIWLGIFTCQLNLTWLLLIGSFKFPRRFNLYSWLVKDFRINVWQLKYVLFHQTFSFCEFKSKFKATSLLLNDTTTPRDTHSQTRSETQTHSVNLFKRIHSYGVTTISSQECMDGLLVLLPLITPTAASNITTTTATTKSSHSTTTYLLQYTTGFHTSYNVSMKDQAHSQFSWVSTTVVLKL